MREHYNLIVRGTEKSVERSMKFQNLEEKSPHYGAFSQPDGVYQAKYAIYCISDMAAVYCCKDSRFYHDKAIYGRILLGLDYVDRVQHENGLFDYVTCNFFSAPDTAFCIKKIIPHLQYLTAGDALTAEEAALMARLRRIIHAGARGLLEGGFHTPNHRWAIASILSVCGKLFGEQELTQAAFAYLNEGIDCNGDGEFSEKSAGNYNRVNNDAMMMLSEGLDDPSYEQHAIRNLRMMLTYWEPDDSVFTANSTRFDKDRLVYPEAYYWEYLSLGVRYDVPEFIAMANYIFGMLRERRLDPPGFLMELMNHPELAAYESELCGTPDHYRAFYAGSGIARVRRGRYTYTVMRDKSNFLYVHNGSIKLAVKIGGSFCEHRAFKAETMEEDADGAFHLHQTMRGWYYLPFEEKPATSDWWQMDNASRKKKLGPDMGIDVVIRETAEGLDVDIRTSGVEGAPWRVELAFNGISRISNEHMTMPINGDEVLVLRDSDFQVMNEEASMTIGPAFGVHHFTEGKEDSEVKTPGAATVYMTDYTSFHHVISIRP
ncbi:MAG: hypothetical protein K2N78_05440 [Oscillospiraceae bacterium]|nr:hypothetical protein [Oscillospiraceae bacterium]